MGIIASGLYLVALTASKLKNEKSEGSKNLVLGSDQMQTLQNVQYNLMFLESI